ncbi:MAG: SusC/RagA family TonB-linked outer membrane protein [Bacteroidetes bacterium]|nr:SusC/RagA family TonB-linked outer membrane protein [Bacteroidota bacterium]
MVLVANIASAQRTVTGKVTDAETKEPLIGASVTVVGTTRGAVTDINGSYRVEVPAGSTQLRFAYTGYQEREVTLGSSNELNQELTPGNQISEVVVVGYGSIRKTDATGAVASVTEANFNQGVISSPEQLMQGRAAGVQISTASGEPGGAINIRIRGTSSVRNGNNPLFVVDGVPLAGDDISASGQDAGFGSSAARNPLNFLNPNDIASIDILKDASATAIYGSRGANGVVLITTKRGGSGKGSLSYDYSLGLSKITKKYDLLNGKDFLAAYAKFNGEAAARALDGGAQTDWQDAIFRSAVTHNHNLSYGATNNGGDYRFSLSYQDQEGIIRESGMRRLTARFTGSKKFMNDRLTMSTNVTVSSIHDDNAAIGNNAGFEGDLLGTALKSNPTNPIKIKRVGGNVADSLFQVSKTEANPVAILEYSKDYTNTIRTLGNMTAEYKIIEGLTFKTVLGFDASSSSRRAAYSRDLFTNTVFGKGRLYMNDVETQNRLWENYFTYTKSFGQTNLTALLGYSYQNFGYTSKGFEMTNFRTSNLDQMINNMASANLASGNNSIVASNSSHVVDELQSYFGRVNLGFADKFLFTATLRADGSTKFGGNNKYGYFPSFSFKYRLIEEGFVPEFFSDLGLRLGYGVTGNQSIPHNLYQRRQRYGDWDIDTGGAINGGVLGDVTSENPNLKWEQTSQLNIGLDFGIIKGRVSGSIDLYNKDTKDLLILVRTAQPASTDFFYNNLDANVINRGVELNLNIAAVAQKNFSWNILFNAAYNHNEVKNYSGLLNTGEINGQGLTGAFCQRIANGQPLYAFFVREFGGFDKDGITKYTGKGDVQVFTGASPLPKWNAGFTNSFRYKNLDLSIFFNGQFGQYVYNNTANAYFTAGALANGRNVSKDVAGNGESNLNAPDVSSRFLEKASFVRLQNLSLGYHVPVKSNKISNLRFFVTAQNLAVFTNYSGQDPEVNVNKAIDGVPSSGIDYNAYPRAKSLLLGASVSF